MTRPQPRIRSVPPGAVVLSEFTLAEVSDACRVSQSTAWRWGQPDPKGTGGIVPARYHVPLLQLARHLGRTLSTDDLILGRSK